MTKELKEIENVKVLYTANVKSCNLPDHQENNVNVCLENGNTFTCELLVSQKFFR